REVAEHTGGRVRARGDRARARGQARRAIGEAGDRDRAVEGAARGGEAAAAEGRDDLGADPASGGARHAERRPRRTEAVPEARPRGAERPPARRAPGRIEEGARAAGPAGRRAPLAHGALALRQEGRRHPPPDVSGMVSAAVSVAIRKTPDELFALWRD